MSNILGEITDFFGQRTRNTLELRFFTQEILNFRNGELLNRATRTNRRLVVKKLADTSLAQIKVVDNLVFPFSFKFSAPKNPNFYRGKMLCLPRPLLNGHLEIDPNGQKVILEFTIDAPDKALVVAVRQEYRTLMEFALV